MDLMTFLPLSRSNSIIDKSQIFFGAVDFRPHPPTLIPVFTNLDQEMDLTIVSLNFRVGSLCSRRPLDSIYSGLPATKIAAVAISETYVSSSSEVNSPVSIKPASSKEDLADPLNEILHNLDFKDTSDLHYQSDASEENFDGSSNFDFEEDFADLYESFQL
jgi:hypothetical protein